MVAAAGCGVILIKRDFADVLHPQQRNIRDHSEMTGTWRQHYDHYSKLYFIQATTSTPTQPPRLNNHLYSDKTSSPLITATNHL